MTPLTAPRIITIHKIIQRTVLLFTGKTHHGRNNHACSEATTDVPINRKQMGTISNIKVIMQYRQLISRIYQFLRN